MPAHVGRECQRSATAFLSLDPNGSCVHVVWQCLLVSPGESCGAFSPTRPSLFTRALQSGDDVHVMCTCVPAFAKSAWPDMIRACACAHCTRTGALDKLSDANYDTARTQHLADPAAARLQYGKIGSWDVSEVTLMDRDGPLTTAFQADINAWKTARVTKMNYMFWGAETFNQPLGSWQTGKVVHMLGMFRRAYSFNQNIGSWQMSFVATIDEMFHDTRSFNQPIGAWDTGSLKYMTTIFLGASSFNQVRKTQTIPSLKARPTHHHDDINKAVSATAYSTSF